jgi:hypothetical protein
MPKKETATAKASVPTPLAPNVPTRVIEKKNPPVAIENPVQNIRQQRIFKALQEEIKRIEKTCKEGEKVVITTFGLIVQDVELASGELVIVRGMDSEGSPISCVQHLEQLSLVVSKREVEEHHKAVRQIGFRERFWVEDE